MANEEFGAVTFGKNGEVIPVGGQSESFTFPDEVATPEATKEVKAAVPEVDIEIVDDTPEKDRNKKPMASPPEEVTDDELEAYDVKVQKRIKKLGKGYHDERRAKEEALRMREEAIRVAQTLMEENKRLQSTLHEGSKVLIDQSKSTAEAELAMAKKAYKEAYDAGDSDALADAQIRVSEAVMKLNHAKNLQPVEPKESNIQVPQSVPEQPEQDPKLAKWLDENDWYGGETPEEDEMTGLAITIHNRLAREFGEKYVGSDEYYEKINATIRKRFPDYFGSTEDLEAKTPVKEETPRRAKPAANVVAPATRSVAPKKIQLTPSQVQIAKRLGVPLELYAKKVAEQMNGDR